MDKKLALGVIVSVYAWYVEVVIKIIRIYYRNITGVMKVGIGMSV